MHHGDEKIKVVLRLQIPEMSFIFLTEPAWHMIDAALKFFFYPFIWVKIVIDIKMSFSRGLWHCAKYNVTAL